MRDSTLECEFIVVKLVAEIDEAIKYDKFKTILREIYAKWSADENEQGETTMVFQLIEGQM